MSQLNREEILDGIYFNSISDDRFKTNLIALYFAVPLHSSTAATYALLPNILRKGCRSYPDFTEFNKYLSELYGASVDYGVEKFGDEQLVSLSIVGIDDKFTLEQEQITEKLARALADMALDPILAEDTFPENELELEKNSLIDTINAEINDKRTYALNAATRLMCADEPYGLSKYGTVDEVHQITKTSLTEAYHKLIRQAHVEILFVGCGCANTAKEVFRSSFAKVERAFSGKHPTSAHRPLAETLAKTERLDVSQSKMVLGFSTGLTADDARIPALHLMSVVLGGTPMSKLFLNVREKLSLCYYCAARLDSRKGIVKIDCGVETENIERAKEEILRQLDEIKAGHVTDEEIKNAVMSLENSYRTVNDSNGSVALYYLGRIFAEQICTPEEMAARLKQVTKEQIIEAAGLLHLDAVYILTGKEA
jgi:predicted Zn-dependent peptidase